MSENRVAPTGAAFVTPGAHTLDGVVVSQLIASVNDYAPDGIADADMLFLFARTAVNVTGLIGGIRARVLRIFVRAGSSIITFKNADVGSAAANRFAFGTDVPLAAGAFIDLVYDTESSRWYLASALAAVAASAGASITFTKNALAAPAQLGGLPASATDGAVQIYANTGTDSLLVLINEDTTQPATTRLQLPRPRMFLTPRQNATFVYDITLARWRFSNLSRDPLTEDTENSSLYLSLLTTNPGSSRLMVGNVGSTANNSPSSVQATNEYTQDGGNDVSTTAVAGTMAGLQQSGGYFLRGSGAGRGGFFLYTRIGFANHGANDLGGVILGPAPSGQGAIANPSAYNNSVSISWDAGQTTLRARSRDGAATTNVDLGANFPSNLNTASYECVLFCSNGQNRLNYFVRRLDAIVADAIGSIVTNLPGAASQLVAAIFVSNNAAATNVHINWNVFKCSSAW